MEPGLTTRSSQPPPPQFEKMGKAERAKHIGIVVACTLTVIPGLALLAFRTKKTIEYLKETFTGMKAVPIAKAPDKIQQTAEKVEGAASPVVAPPAAEKSELTQKSSEPAGEQFPPREGTPLEVPKRPQGPAGRKSPTKKGMEATAQMPAMPKSAGPQPQPKPQGPVGKRGGAKTPREKPPLKQRHQGGPTVTQGPEQSPKDGLSGASNRFSALPVEEGGSVKKKKKKKKKTAENPPETQVVQALVTGDDERGVARQNPEQTLVIAKQILTHMESALPRAGSLFPEVPKKVGQEMIDNFQVFSNRLQSMENPTPEQASGVRSEFQEKWKQLVEVLSQYGVTEEQIQSALIPPQLQANLEGVSKKQIADAAPLEDVPPFQTTSSRENLGLLPIGSPEAKSVEGPGTGIREGEIKELEGEITLNKVRIFIERAKAGGTNKDIESFVKEVKAAQENFESLKVSSDESEEVGKTLKSLEVLMEIHDSMASLIETLKKEPEWKNLASSLPGFVRSEGTDQASLTKYAKELVKDEKELLKRVEEVKGLVIKAYKIKNEKTTNVKLTEDLTKAAERLNRATDQFIKGPDGSL